MIKCLVFFINCVNNTCSNEAASVVNCAYWKMELTLYSTWVVQWMCSPLVAFSKVNYVLFVFGATAPQWATASSFTRFLDHTRRRTTVGRTPLDEWSARRRDIYLTHNTHNRQTSMPSVGFEPTISAGERPQSYALGRAATGTGNYVLYLLYISCCRKTCNQCDARQAVTCCSAMNVSSRTEVCNCIYTVVIAYLAATKLMQRTRSNAALWVTSCPGLGFPAFSRIQTYPTIGYSSAVFIARSINYWQGYAKVHGSFLGQGRI